TVTTLIPPLPSATLFPYTTLFRSIRRIIVPADKVEDVQIALGKRLQSTIIGDPKVEGVRMGPLAGLAQRTEVSERIAELAKTQRSEEHTSELQSRSDLVCRLLLEK